MLHRAGCPVLRSAVLLDRAALDRLDEVRGHLGSDSCNLRFQYVGPARQLESAAVTPDEAVFDPSYRPPSADLLWRLIRHARALLSLVGNADIVISISVLEDDRIVFWDYRTATPAIGWA